MYRSLSTDKVVDLKNYIFYIFTGEMYKTVLLIYEHENEQPLPQWDEVLVCSRTTTVDEVKLSSHVKMYLKCFIYIFISCNVVQ